MTQHEKILRYMIAHPAGMTIQDGMRLGINWPHKRVGELEQFGVGIRRIDEVRDGVRFRRYMLADPEQQRVKELIRGWS